MVRDILCGVTNMFINSHCVVTYTFLHEAFNIVTIFFTFFTNKMETTVLNNTNLQRRVIESVLD